MVEEKRDNLRITDQLRFTYERMLPEEYKKFESNIKDSLVPFSVWTNNLASFVGNQGVLDKIRVKSPEIGDMLEQIDSKLNIILGLLNPANEGTNLFKIKPTFCDLSASGFGFVSDDEAIKTGDILKINMLIVSPHITQISFCIEVLRLDKKEVSGVQKRWVASKICLISEQVKELIIRHIFDMQKEWLRMRNQQKEYS